MDIFSILAAFGGGAFGATVGALPAFIMTGIVALIGTAIGLGSGVDMITGNVAFGAFFGPHVAFAGGVAAAAYAARKNNMLAGGNLGGGDVAVASPQGITNGADILYSLNGTGDWTVLGIGGIFGILGLLINHLYANILAFPTDTVAMTVATSGLIVRFLIGRTGLLGKYEGREPRAYVAKGNELRKLHNSLKKTMSANGIKNSCNNVPQSAHPFREYKRYPVSKLIYKLGLNSYDVKAPISDVTISSNTISILLSQHIGAPSIPVVNIGDKVFKGDLIAKVEDNKLGSNIHSSVDGVISDIRDNMIIINRGM